MAIHSSFALLCWYIYFQNNNSKAFLDIREQIYTTHLRMNTCSPETSTSICWLCFYTWESISCIHWKSAIANTRAVPSVETETREVPSFDMARDWITSEWPLNVRKQLPERLSHTRTLPSTQPVATYLDEPSHRRHDTPSCQNMIEMKRRLGNEECGAKGYCVDNTDIMITVAACRRMLNIPNYKLLIHTSSCTPRATTSKN